MIQWYQYVSLYKQGYDFCFAQIFGNKLPNIMLRWQDGSYSVWSTRNSILKSIMTGSTFKGASWSAPPVSSGKFISNFVFRIFI